MKNQKNRSMKVYSQNGRNYKATPTIILKGQWLEKMGFAIGDYISVSCENGKLVITPDNERAELEQMKADFMEKEAKKLQKRFQREKEELHAQFVTEKKAQYMAENRKTFSMFSRTSPTTSLCRCKIIHDRINPCIANQIQIRIFINDGYQVLFCIPAVTKDDDMIFAVKFRHNLPDHGGCQFQFRLFFLPHTITKRNGKIRYFIPIPDRYTEHDTHKAVSIQIIRTVVCGMVKQF